MRSPKVQQRTKKTRLHDTMIFWKQMVRMQLHKRLNARELAPRARFELATLRLTAECSTIELPGNRQVRFLVYNTDALACHSPLHQWSDSQKRSTVSGKGNTVERKRYSRKFQ